MVILGMLTLCLVSLQAGVTTYTFTSTSWASVCGSQKCDGKTDGWVSELNASSYDAGRTDAMGRLYSCGVSVKTGSSGAGARSVKSFTNVRSIGFNFCQNASDGRGTIYVQVGDSTMDSIVVHKPEKGMGIYMRDSVIRLVNQPSGKIRFWVRCTANAINIHSITIRAQEGGSTPFTTSSFQLVRDVSELQDSDQIIIGVMDAQTQKIMGYFDETVSQNNIHAIAGRYSDNRQQVGRNDEAIYTLRRGETSTGTEAWYIQDEIRYEEAYLVASGGQTKNRLALWNHLWDEKAYGDYGYWDIQIAPDGEATIMNLGRSLGKYIQYNSHNNPTLFGCYANLSQGAVCLYREVPALGDSAAIVADMVQFGHVVMQDSVVSGQQTIAVQANRLTSDIQCRLVDSASVFGLSRSVIDRDGDELTIYYTAREAGKYTDTLILSSDSIVTRVGVMLQVIKPMSIAQVKTMVDYTSVYLNDVVVTKKYDTYIFVRDSTGSMLIFDNGDGSGGRYGSGLEQGHVLHGVRGRYQNYFGVPELSPDRAWGVLAQKQTCLPEVVTEVDSSDVCRYVRLENGTVTDDYQWNGIPVIDAFNTGISTGNCTMDAIVYWSWNTLQLWLVNQSVHTDITTPAVDTTGEPYYNLLGQKVSADYRGITIQRHQKVLMR